MHCKNERQDNNKTYTHQDQHQPEQQKTQRQLNTATMTLTSGSTTSSTDSGIIIIDDKLNNESKFHNNKNTNNANVYNNIDKIDKNDGDTPTTIKITDNSEKFKHTNEQCNNTNSPPTRSIKIENIINVTKGGDGGGGGGVEATNKTTEGHQHQHQQQQQHNKCCNGECNIDDGSDDGVCCDELLHSTAKTKHTHHHSPTTSSLRSTSISIASIDEDAISSSVIDSDSDHEADAEGVHANYVVKKLGQQTYPPGSNELPNINNGLKVISQQINPNSLNANPMDMLSHGAGGMVPPPAHLTKASGALTPPTPPQIGNIAISNSTDVTFGDRNFFEGPVVIQQIVIDDPAKKRKSAEGNGYGGGGGGHDNPMFESDYDASGANADQKTPLYRKKAILITATIVGLTILICVILLNTIGLKSQSKSKQPYGESEDSRKNIPINSTIDKDNVGGGRILRIIARDGWLAQPSVRPLEPLKLPLNKVVVIETQTDVCTTQAMCTYRVRYIQTFNIESQQTDDIIYNFLIGGDGNVYEGRGWDLRGAHLRGYNNETLSLAYIGTFRNHSPNQKQLEITKLLLARGVRENKLTPDYKIYAASKFDPTALETASSKALYDSFKTWDHWSD